MQNYQQHLSQESLDALSTLLDSKIQSVISHFCDIDAGSSILTVTSLSIPIGKAKFIIIDNDWADTPKNYINYYFLSIRIAANPSNIHYEPEPAPGGANYKADHLSLHLGAQAQVKRIDVLSASEVGPEESVDYDAGLLITREDGLRLAIVRQESISGFLQIAHTETEITTLTTGLDMRLSLCL
ncbi:hypothetical protein JQK19_11095 [Chromobacterium violaceum]|uniref:hypothetical protein n=1 Tax=Chromobacterium violaceum TaxID=536 RepID=UPI001BE71A4F|nr:hypothetical protein [Chromobacterium violaceum]MBT2867787.1 hypothetical protein [Chromobacterium violaceum]